MATISLDTGHYITTYPESKASTLVAPKGTIENVKRRAACAKFYRKADGSHEVHCWNKYAPVHYKDDYAKDTEWKEIDPTYYEDQGTYLEFSRMPHTVRVWKDKIGYEITDRRTGKVMSAELLELDNEKLSLSAKKNKVDFDIHVQSLGVRLWKHTKVNGPTKFKWLVKDVSDKESWLKFREVPEAKDVNGKSVVVETSKVLCKGGYYFTEQVDKTGISIDTDFTGQTSDGYIFGRAALYSSARSTSLSYDTSGSLVLGQEYSGSHIINRAFLDFDTSAITETVTQANLRMVTLYDSSTTDFDIQIVKQTWQEALGSYTEDNYDGCLAGTADANIWRNTSGMSVETQYTSGNLSTAWVNISGDTKYSLRSSRDYAGTEPSGNEKITLASADNETTSYRPCLIVVEATGFSGKVMGVASPAKVMGVQ